MTPELVEPGVVKRFWERVDKRGPDECWLWTGSRLESGRGRGRGIISVRGKTTVAPRLSLLIAGEAPPSDDSFACHTCDNPACVNPAHLWWGSNQENIIDASTKGLLWQNRTTHCPQGHPYSGHNLMIVKGKSRRCRACDVARLRRWRNKKREAARG